MDSGGWATNDDLNILSSANQAKIRSAFDQPGVVVFGWHYWYAGGMTRDAVILTSRGDFDREIARSRPGDHFTMYDLARMEGLAFVRFKEPDSLVDGKPVGPPTNRLDEALSDLSNLSWGEVNLVQRRRDPVSGATTGELRTITSGQWTDWEALRSEPAFWRGEVFGFTTSVLNEDAAGVPIAGVSPLERRRVHALLDAKIPDLTGRVPRSGPY
jgi:hypothetical protein